MEPDIPSELDISHYRVGSRSSSEDASELHDTLIGQWYGLSGGECKLIPGILQVFGVCIVQGTNLTLGIAVPLLRVSHVVCLSREQSDGGHAGREPSSDIGSREDLSGS